MWIETTYTFFLQKSFSFINSNTRGIGIPHVDPEVLWNIPFPLAPIKEQKLISQKLKNFTDRISQFEKKAHLISKKIEKSKQASLESFFKTQLNWSNIPLSEVCKSVTDGDHQAPPKSSEGVAFLMISNISDGSLNIDSVKRFVPQDYYEGLKEIKKPALGDILFTVTGSIGIPVLVNIDNAFAFQRHIALLKPDVEKIRPKFLYYFLLTENAKQQGQNAATGIAQLTIPLRGLRRFNIPLPPLNEQDIIINKISKIFKIFEKVSKKYKSATDGLVPLKTKILDIAFTGQLIDIEVNDSVDGLLKDIRKEKIKLKDTLKLKKSKAKVTKNKITQMDIYEIVKKNGTPIKASEVWKQSIFSDDIDKFYDELKNEIELNRIKESRNKEYLELG